MSGLRFNKSDGSPTGTSGGVKGSGVEIIDTEEQQKPVARCRVIGARQRGMSMGAPLEAEQDSPIRIEDLPKEVMSRKSSRLTEQCLVPFKAVGTSSTPMIVHKRFIGPPCGDDVSLASKATLCLSAASRKRFG